MSNAANLGMGGLRPFRFGSPRGNMDYDKKCLGEHEIYVAECVISPSNGTITVVTVCRHCDRVSFHQKQVAEPGRELVATKDVK